MSGREKATIFLSILGADASARILRYLPEEIADLIASGVNQLPSPSPEALTTVLQEFRSYMTLPASGPRRGLAEAPGRPPQPPDTGPAGILRRTSPEALARVLSGERPEILGFVAAHLPPALSDEFLESFGDRRAAVEKIRNQLKRHRLTPQVEERVFTAIAGRLVGR